MSHEIQKTSNVREIARTLDATPALLPFLPELLIDLDELGDSPSEIMSMLEHARISPSTAAIDLGCGKGVISIEFARLGMHVLGVDAFQPFIDNAQARATVAGFDSTCDFLCADLRVPLASNLRFDLAALLSVGPFEGDWQQTIASLRRPVRPGGLILISDGFVTSGAPPSEGFEGYVNHAETIRALESCGDSVIHERIFTSDESRRATVRFVEPIRRRAKEIALRQPEHAALVMSYVDEQEKQLDILTGPITNAIWLIRRA